jgi:hypothetical protein
MFLRSCRLLVLALVVSACSSSAGASLGRDGGTAAVASRGNSRLIVRAELDSFQGGSVFDAVQILRRRWTDAQTVSSLSGPIYARVVIDGTFRGELNELHRLSTDDIETMRFLSLSDATTKYGTGYLGGVIEVETIRGP